MTLHYQRLEQAALDVIDALRQIPQFSDLGIAVIGGFARVHHNRGSRGTSDVDFIIDTAEIALEREIKQAILNLGGTDFSQEAHVFRHVLNGGTDYCRVDFFPRDICPYLPPAAQQVQHIPLNAIPFISPTDLIVFKIHSCGTRGDATKNKDDAVTPRLCFVRWPRRSRLHDSSKMS
ncbi:hypothetical protein C8A01DRAFT_37706 [Parachaetomium inaequale]|uniref:Nucleotidyltransferase n=1 Tax=Parachaetomium inaequale TaxID=2588326 RepID=A0AAN6PCA4_9PEZI|nr:hypothetical protein C8A01DRAFT_37706 [Parachaetomium inaequale]